MWAISRLAKTFKVSGSGGSWDSSALYWFEHSSNVLFFLSRPRKDKGGDLSAVYE